MKRKNWLLGALLGMALLCMPFVFVTQAHADDVPGITYDDASKTLTIESGTYTATQIMKVTGEPEKGSIRDEIETIVLNGEIVLDQDEVRGLGQQFFVMMSKLRAVQTNGTVRAQGTTTEDGGGCFGDCPMLEEIDLSKWDFPCFTGMFTRDNQLKKVELSGTVITSDLATFLDYDEGTTPYTFFPLPSLEDITMPSTADFTPGVLDDTGRVSGSWFPYDKEGGWNAYEDGVLQASGLSSYEAFRAYQASHPGMTRYVWVGAPQPEPTPDPEPEPEPTPALEDGWVQDDTGWRYVVDGAYVTGWHWIDDAYGAHWYCFSETDNYMITSAWLWDGAWYWVCSSGPMIQGIWQWIDNAWYGFWWNGQMCEGWVWDADYVAWFYCHNNGIMARNAWADGYYLNDSGVCLL